MSGKSLLYAPRWWPSWLGLGLLRSSIRLPDAWLYRLGRGVGHLLRRVMGYRATIARANLRLCFPDWSDEQREQLFREHMESLGLSLVEMSIAWWSDADRLQPMYSIDGLEHLAAARRQGRGVLLLSAHFTCLELGGRLLNEHHPLSVTYRDFKNPVFHRAMLAARRRVFRHVLPRSDLRGFVRALKAGEIVWYAPDQDMGAEHSVFAPFFGVPAATLTTTSRIARAGSALVMFFQVRRDPEQLHYHLSITPPLDAFPHEETTRDAMVVNRLIEDAVRQAPAQYLWIHRRFKTRQSGDPKLYPVRPKRRAHRNWRMPVVGSAEFQALIAGADVISHDRFGPKVYRDADGRIIKLFRDKRRLSMNSLYPYAERFRLNAQRLRDLGFLTVSVDRVFRLADGSRRGVVYRELAGRTCREWLAGNVNDRPAFIQKMAEFLALLHRQGVYFRSLHLGNILVLEDGELALIDVADLYIQRRALSDSRRARNLFHLLRYRQDWPLFGPAGPGSLVSAYFNSAGCPPHCVRRIDLELRRRLPELRD